jgi:Lipid A 3-O-deacylase (PagL)
MLSNRPFRRLGAVLALSLLPALPAAAVQYQFQVGRSYMDSHGTNAAFAEAVFDEHMFGASNFSWSPDVSLGWIDGRDVPRYRYSRPGTDDNVWLAAGGLRFRYGDEASWYHSLFFSEQGAVHTGHTQALSSTGEFVSTLGWQARHFSLSIRHISNAGLHDPNRGATMALVGIAFGGND